MNKDVLLEWVDLVLKIFCLELVNSGAHEGR